MSFFSRSSLVYHCCVGLVLLAGLLLPTRALVAGPVIERISFSSSNDGGGFVVRIHSSERVHAYSEPKFIGQNQVELILFNAELARHAQQDSPSGPVKAYAVKANSGHLYLRFHLDGTVQTRASAYRDRSTEDMLLGFAYISDRSATLPSSIQTVSSRSTPIATQEPSLNDARRRWKLDTIVIDAGHGGKDTGAVGYGGLREKDVVLDVALKVGQYIESRLGINVVYTRDRDQFITLRNRGRIANEAGGKLFISIHANAHSRRSAHGTETYFLGMHKSDAAQSVMERENSVIHFESNPDEYTSMDEEALILQTLAQSAYMRTSEELAGLVQAQFHERVGRVDRGVKQAGFYVLWNASMPSILVELGFVTNANEAAFLKSESGQDYLASAIFRAVRDFRAQYEKGLDGAVSQ